MTTMTSSYPIANFFMMNFRKQTAAKFVANVRTNPETKKKETFYDIQNDAGYGYKVSTPPMEAQWPKLQEGGNLGGMYSKTKQTSSITTNLLFKSSGDDFQSERDDFEAFMDSRVESSLQQMWEADPNGISTSIRNKIKKRFGKKKTMEELETLAFKSFKKTALVPIKEKDGKKLLVVKCRAFNKDLSPRQIRYVQPAGNKYSEMESVPILRNGALLTVAFGIRPFVMSADKFGLTFTLIPDICVYSTGTARPTASIEDIETVGRPYVLSKSEGKDGKTYLNIQDEQGCALEVRGPAAEVVFGSDLTGDGTLGKFGGVTEAQAKFSGMVKEDPSNPDSVAYFDYMDKLAKDVVDFAMNDDNLLVKLKAESKEDAEEMAASTGKSFEEEFKAVIMESFTSPINKREEDNYRQFKFSQNVFNRNGVRNNIPIVDADGNPVEGSIQRGAMIAPVVRPSVYFMPDGKFGMKCSTSIEHGIRVDSNPEAQDESGGVLYHFKRSAPEDESEAPALKRTKTDA